jgi:hypothetical protein
MMLREKHPHLSGILLIASTVLDASGIGNATIVPNATPKLKNSFQKTRYWLK